MGGEPVRRSAGDVVATYREREDERVLELDRDGRTVVLAQTAAGYAMVSVRMNGEEQEAYYGFDMAIDHAAELLRVSPQSIPIPDPATSMGM